MTAAEDDEVIGIRDDVRAERLSPSTETPMLQESVHVDDREQRTDDTPSRRAACAALADIHAPFPIAIPLFGRCS